jgi:hypothetical protein
MAAPAKKSLWDRIGSALAGVAKVAAAGALWASEHPEVITAVQRLAKAKRGQ